MVLETHCDFTRRFESCRRRTFIFGALETANRVLPGANIGVGASSGGCFATRGTQYYTRQNTKKITIAEFFWGFWDV